MPKLYELTAAYRALEEATDADMDDSTFMALVDHIDGALKEKATGTAMVLQNIEATTEAMKKAERRMADRRKVLERRAAGIEAYILNNMLAVGMTSIECAEFKISVRQNPEKVVIDDASKVPAEYLRAPPPEPDKKAIMEDIKQGVVIDGVHTERDHRLEIR